MRAKCSPVRSDVRTSVRSALTRMSSKMSIAYAGTGDATASINDSADRRAGPTHSANTLLYNTTPAPVAASPVAVLQAALVEALRSTRTHVTLWFVKAMTVLRAIFVAQKARRAAADTDDEVQAEDVDDDDASAGFVWTADDVRFTVPPA